MEQPQTPPRGDTSPLETPKTVRARLPEGKRVPVADFKMIVSRFELRPNTDWLVGFELKSDQAGKKSTVDIVVPAEKAKDKTDYEIIMEAWHLLKDRIKYEKALFETTPSVIGSEFIPPEEI